MQTRYATAPPTAANGDAGRPPGGRLGGWATPLIGYDRPVVEGSERGVTVLIVDDHLMFAETLADALRGADGVDSVALATDASTAMAHLDADAPDVVLLDSRLPDQQGSDVARTMLERCSSVRIVMLTADDSSSNASAAFKAGCVGFVTKQESVSDVLAAMRDAVNGSTHLSPAMLARLAHHAPHAVGPNLDLTYRELEILELISEGLSGPAIAEGLGLSHHTVRNHTQSILRKLGVHSRLEAVTKARRLRLISEPT